MEKPRYIERTHYSYIARGYEKVSYGDGTVFYLMEGNRHHEYGPAIIYPEGEKMWYLNNNRLTKDYFTNLEMINQFEAWELFDPIELARMKRLV